MEEGVTFPCGARGVRQAPAALFAGEMVLNQKAGARDGNFGGFCLLSQDRVQLAAKTFGPPRSIMLGCKFGANIGAFAEPYIRFGGFRRLPTVSTRCSLRRGRASKAKSTGRGKRSTAVCVADEQQRGG